MDFFATSAPHSEEATAAEILQNGVPGAVPLKGKVLFRTDPEKACELAFNLRTARRVLMPLGNFRFSSRDDLYSGASEIGWEELLSPSMTFSVRVKGEDDAVRNTSFAALVLKDAIVDRIREKKGSRPSVDRDDPDATILAHIDRGRAEVSLDLGGPLHKRGYRLSASPGSLNETLAAVMLRLAGYDGSEPFYDPMCGSGTIGIEAALVAARIAPGLLWRRGRGFFSMPLLDEDAKKRIVVSARERMVTPPHPIRLSDLDTAAVKSAVANAGRARVERYIDFRVLDLFSVTPAEDRGLLLSNTPYGDHVEPDQGVRDLLKRAGDKLKKDFRGFTAGLLVGGKEAAKCVGLRAFRKFSLYNGSREVRLCLYRLYEGSEKPA